MHDTTSSSIESANAIAVATLLDAWRHERPSGLMAHRVVIDRLLDLRNLLPDNRRQLVDGVLVGIPGRSVVEAGWWSDQVAELHLLLTDPTS